MQVPSLMPDFFTEELDQNVGTKGMRILLHLHRAASVRTYVINALLSSMPAFCIVVGLLLVSFCFSFLLSCVLILLVYLSILVSVLNCNYVCVCAYLSLLICRR